jgi:Protein of unknown function (DUF1064)
MTTLNERAQWARFLGETPEPRNKYGAKAMVVDGIRFDSTKEANRYGELRLLEKAGAITNLEMQPRFPIDVVRLWDAGRWTWGSGKWKPAIVACGVFRADFRYVDATTGETVIEDVKSGPTKTTAYRLRKRLVEAIHGITISEV